MPQDDPANCGLLIFGLCSGFRSIFSRSVGQSMSRSSNITAASALVDKVESLARASELAVGGVKTRVWSLGWSEVDAALPAGVPRGQVTEWAGPRSVGKTAMLRQIIGSVRQAGVGAAYVDGTRTLAPAPWAVEKLEKPGLSGAPSPPSPPPFWVVRPPLGGEGEGGGGGGILSATEELLRSGAFGLVVVEGADWSRTPVIRLQRLTREMDAALIAVVDRAGRVPLAGFRVEFSSPQSFSSWDVRRVQIRGRGFIGELVCVQDLPYRLCRDSGLPDRALT